jgi:glycoprotein endo-alpha-1,2-mannosidase
VRRRATRPPCALLAAVLTAIAALVLVPTAGAAPESGLHHPLVGAYYYLWNPQNMATGTLRAHLSPAQAPSPGHVNSHDPRTAARDIAEARKAGIDFFAVDWWPYDPGYSGRDYRQADSAMQDFLAAPDLGQMRFAMFYETWNLGFDPLRESTPITFQMELHFDADMIHFARTYFANPSYLRIGGRPVVFLYLSRTLTGDVAGMLRGARTVLEEHGYDPYFIGDEVYWRVTPETLSPAGPVLTTTPQVGRMEQFDAVTSYILYYGDPQSAFGPAKDSWGYPGTTNVAADQRFLLTVYRNATGGKVPVVPDVAPGFNDRGFRLWTNHPVEPRQWLPGDGPASTLDHLFRCVAIPELDPSLPMVMLTSWDDWNEDTGIEPIGGTPTRVDDSPSTTAYTQGYEYGGEGTAAVRMLRRDVALLDQHAARLRQPGNGSGPGVSDSGSTPAAC